ncbi:MAG: enolase C-terminal domain-like protein [Verrucomicrobiota bacterium]
MSAEIQYHRYVLKSRVGLNARSERRELEGCLIRVGSGVGCIHPWVELGDECLQGQLDALRASKPLRLGQRALHCARLDGQAREQEVSLFAGLSIPDSHLTVAGDMDLNKQDCAAFSRIKIKGAADLEKARKKIQLCLAQVAPDCLLRIDFNESLEAAVAMNLAQVLGSEICERIEFIEDPVSYHQENWQRLRRQTGLSLAVDRDCEQGAGERAAADWLVIKPAVVDAVLLTEQLDPEKGQKKWLVTSYMDHAIGQMFAAYQAALLQAKYPEQLRQCGLLTHHLFERDEFFESVQSEGPKLLVPRGTGLGFDDQLQTLPWKTL